MDPGERYKHLKATNGQDDVKISAYCRQNGLYPHQLAQWETEFMAKSTHANQQQSKVEIKALQAEVKGLKKIIMRKDKVLAETVALLILKKKAAPKFGGTARTIISMVVRNQAIMLVKEASIGGARRYKSCEIIGLSLRTLERWEKEKGQHDKRANSNRVPANKLIRSNVKWS